MVFAVVPPDAPAIPMLLPALALFSVVPNVEMLPPPHARTVPLVPAVITRRSQVMRHS